jgi:hypothetical protein
MTKMQKVIEAQKTLSAIWHLCRMSFSRITQAESTLEPWTHIDSDPTT